MNMNNDCCLKVKKELMKEVKRKFAMMAAFVTWYCYKNLNEMREKLFIHDGLNK